MRKALFLLLSLLTAQPLVAACTLGRFTIAPPRPTSSDEIEIVMAGGCSDGCIPHHPRVRVAAGTITIESAEVDGCILIPQPWGERVTVGRVPAGTYEVVVRHEERDIARQTLVVRDHPFTIAPTLGDEGTEVHLGRQVNVCAHPCVLPKVLFGGVESPKVTLSPVDNGIVAVAPAHAPGLVDITVVDAEDATKSITAEDAFLYPEIGADLTPEMERVFFPSVFAGAGAHGSRWDSRNVVLNRGPVAVSVPPADDPLDPRERRMLPTLGRDGGMFLFIPRGVESGLAYSSHIVDESRRTGDAGTELPVVHEQQTASRVTILDVPLTTESRQTLRIFDFDAIDGRQVTVDVRVEGRPPVTLTAGLTERIVCVIPPCYPLHPTFAVINLDASPSLRGAGTADITISGRTNDAPLWAYVSVTNNDTQHVTAYTPQHRR